MGCSLGGGRLPPCFYLFDFDFSLLGKSTMFFKCQFDNQILMLKRRNKYLKHLIAYLNQSVMELDLFYNLI